MARTLCYVATLLVSIHIANSYILLTANVEDVHALAKQIAASPVVQQINKIFRRASNQFNEQMKQPKDNMQMRANQGESSADQKESRSRSSESGEQASSGSTSRRQRRSRADGDGLAALGKSASYYLASINKILKNI